MLTSRRGDINSTIGSKRRELNIIAERRSAIPDSEFKVHDDGSGHLFVHVDELRANEGVTQYRTFYSAVDNAFLLRAENEEDVLLSAERGMWMQEFYLRIPPDEFSKMKNGVDYLLLPLNRHGPMKWATRGSVFLRRASGE